MSITCDRLQVRRHEQENTIEEMIATGHVHFQDGTRHATAERADYIEAEHKLVLTGQPRAWDTQENNELNGEEIVLFVQEEKMVVKRARMRFHPDNVSSKVP
jgi:lipopolysaccharide transport protein LptA